MAKFFFDLHECGEVIADQDGSEIDSLDAAREQAITAARDIMCGEISRGTLCLSCHIEIRDEAHAVLDRVPFRDAVAITGL